MKRAENAVPDRRQEEGVALIMGLFLVIFALGVTITGSIFLNANRTKTRVEFVLNSQAAQFAQSGLTEALNWMRRQSSQPVTALEPVLDMAATPQILDTDEPDIGMVRSFKISGNTWGRYEVWKQWDADPVSTRLPFRQLMEARDITSERGGTGTGTSWLLKGVGYVYELRDTSKAFDEFPNRVLAQEILEMEASRLSFSIPGQAAINSTKGGNVNVQAGAEVLGGGTAAGIYYQTGNGVPNIVGTVTGTPPTSPTASMDLSPLAVFGVSEDGLRNMADQVVTLASDFPNPVPAGSLIFVDLSSIDFDNAAPLTGNGIVYFNGSVNIKAGSASLFSGLIYMKSAIVIDGPAEIRGAILTGVDGNTVELKTIGGLVSVIYDQAVLDALQDDFGVYRQSRATRRLYNR
ncbi:MAG: hypothetical protein ACYTG5_03850 [Planctomycetota bacterium]|jgi:hypothetical protein